MIKQKQEAGLFDKEVWLDKLVSINTSLDKLKLLINWEVFLPLFPLLRKTKKKKSVYRDKAYCSTFINQQLDNYDIENKIVEKAYKNRPLTEAQQAENREKNRKRCRVEHVFGFIKGSNRGSCIRSIGFERAAGIIGLINLTYNLLRTIQLIKLRGLKIRWI